MMTSSLQLICAGLPFSNEDALRPAEREQLGLWRARARKRAVVYGVIGTLPVVSFVAMHFMPSAALILFSTLGAILTPILWLGAVKYGLDVRRYAKALADDRVLRFVRLAPHREVGYTDALQQRLVQRVLGRVDPSDLVAISVLSTSREVLAVNDRFASPGLRANAVAVAKAPAITAQVSLPPGVEVDPRVAKDTTRRALSAGELDELREKIRRLRRLSGGFWFLTALTFAIFLVWRSDGYPVPPKVLTQPIPPALWLFTLYEVARNWRNALRLQRDAALGWVLTFDELRRPPIAGLKRCEVLPASQSVWTLDGEPAAWRGSKWFHTLLIDRR